MADDLGAFEGECGAAKSAEACSLIAFLISDFVISSLCPSIDEGVVHEKNSSHFDFYILCRIHRPSGTAGLEN
jgi:hypothetical protein